MSSMITSYENRLQNAKNSIEMFNSKDRMRIKSQTAFNLSQASIVADKRN